MPEQLFTWDALATLAGASFMTYLIVAYTKRYIDHFFGGGSTDLYAVLVGTAVLLLAALGKGQDFTWATVGLALFNGFLVAATAGKMNDKTLQENEHKKSKGSCNGGRD